MRGRYAGQIDVGLTERPGVYRVTARDYVGRVSLPGGMMLVIQPKVGVSNLFHMLCADAGLARFHPPPAGLVENPDIFGFVLAALIEGVEGLLMSGLYQEYQPRQEDLPLVRGRIVMAAQLRKHGDLKHRHVCLYADRTVDTAENRVAAATLRYLPALLQPRGEKELVRRVRALLPHFEGVRAISRSMALALVDDINLHRLNSAYGPVLALCKLALRHLTLDERAGPHPFASFLVNMPRLFESFLTSRLRAALPAYGLRVIAQRHDYLDEARQVGIRPDVLVYPRSGTQPVLVLDAKYRRLDEAGIDVNSDLYQISAYLDRYGLKRGVLVYPQFKQAAQTELKLRGTPKHLHVITLNLAASDPHALDRHCALLAEQVARLCEVPSAE